MTLQCGGAAVVLAQLDEAGSGQRGTARTMVSTRIAGVGPCAPA